MFETKQMSYKIKVSFMSEMFPCLSHIYLPLSKNNDNLSRVSSGVSKEIAIMSQTVLRLDGLQPKLEISVSASRSK